MKLYLIRHGQTDYNKNYRWQGRVDIPLNSHGELQARKIKQWLEAERIALECIYTSPLIRAMSTANIIEPDPSKILTDERLIEIDLGYYDGRSEDDIQSEIGRQQYDRWRSENFMTPAPGGESLLQVIERVRQFVISLTEYRNENRVGIVAHQGVLVALKSVITGRINQQALDSYKQKNDEIDIWNLSQAGRIRSIQLQ